MRVTSELWVAALVRRAFGAGGFAAVVRRGAAEAGAVFVTVRSRSGEVALYGPAPQTSYAEDRPGERQLQELMRSQDEQAVHARLEKEARFDPDLWVVELELAGDDPAAFFAVTKPGG